MASGGSGPPGDAPEGFGDDGVAHLGGAAFAFDEGDGDFVDAEAAAPGLPGEVDLEAVALGGDTVQVAVAEDVGAVGAEAGGGVA